MRNSSFNHKSVLFAMLFLVAISTSAMEKNVSSKRPDDIRQWILNEGVLKNFSLEEFEQLISSNESKLDSEETIYLLVIMWIGAEKGRKQHFERLIQYVRFPRITKNYLDNNVLHAAKALLGKEHSSIELVEKLIELGSSPDDFAKYIASKKKETKDGKELNDLENLLTPRIFKTPENNPIESLDTVANFVFYDLKKITEDTIKEEKKAELEGTVAKKARLYCDLIVYHGYSFYVFISLEACLICYVRCCNKYLPENFELPVTIQFFVRCNDGIRAIQQGKIIFKNKYEALGSKIQRQEPGKESESRSDIINGTSKIVINDKLEVYMAIAFEKDINKKTEDRVIQHINKEKADLKKKVALRKEAYLRKEALRKNAYLRMEEHIPISEDLFRYFNNQPACVFCKIW